MNYTATTLSLAALETLVHVDIEDAPDDLVSLRIEIPDAVYPRVEAHQLPPPSDVEWYVAQGDAWIRARESLALIVPSMVIPQEYNVLLNPSHADWGQVRVAEPQPFKFDPRLLQ